jgi:hypothetical protein
MPILPVAMCRITPWSAVLHCPPLPSSRHSPRCYDGEALIHQARSAAHNNSLAEIDLGSYETTLPRDQNTDAITELNIHIFGTVSRYHVPAIEKQLRLDEYRLRHETLTAVRKTTRDELAEPSLAQLRERIEKVVNNILAEAPIKSIGSKFPSLLGRD